MAAGMLDAGVDMGNLMSDKCNKLLTTVIVSHSQSQGSGSGVGTIPSMSGEARGALHTFVYKRLTVPARCRAKAGRFRPQNTPGWFHPGPLGKRVWCGRRELNPHGLAACGFSYHFGFRRPAKYGFVVWTIPSPFPIRGLGAARLVSTPSRNCFRAWLGIAISGFPDFEQFYSAGFPTGTQFA